jgi:hypothetical protein
MGAAPEFLHEYDFTVTPRWAFLEKHFLRHFHFPDGSPRLPLMFSLRR